MPSATPCVTFVVASPCVLPGRSSNSVCARPVRSIRKYSGVVRASSLPDNKGRATPDDETLQSELRAKVNELYGGRQNVRIDVDTDSSTVQFTVRNRARPPVYSSRNTIASSSSPSAGNGNEPITDLFRSTRYILTFIAVVSLVTGTFFTALYYSGAIHGFDRSNDSHYEMPAYGTDSYIDPYELLDQESKTLQGLTQQDSTQAQAQT